MTIKNDITSEIDTLIDSMTIAGGYNYNYDNINEYKPASRTYPHVKTIYPEDEFEDPDNQMVDSYTSQLQALFTVTVDDTDSPVDSSLAKVLEDFQRLLESGHATLQTKGAIVGDLLTNTREYSQIRKRPGKIEMEWTIKYRVKRSDPSVTI